MSGSRSIFEDVQSNEKQTAPGPVQIEPGGSEARRAAFRWLAVLAFLLVFMIVIGGLTRLTDSGLSITEWAPITGAVPPLNEADWATEFEKYQQIPEFQLQNSAMTVAEFKTIYWWEWGHRQLGRVIGLVWAAGFFWFLLRKQIPNGWTCLLYTSDAADD